MSWKRASAGETVYNKCPTNATGQSRDAPEAPIAAGMFYLSQIVCLCVCEWCMLENSVTHTAAEAPTSPKLAVEHVPCRPRM